MQFPSQELVKIVTPSAHLYASSKGIIAMDMGLMLLLDILMAFILPIIGFLCFSIFHSTSIETVITDALEVFKTISDKFLVKK